MRLLIIVLSVFCFNTFATEIVIDKDLLELQNKISKERKEQCKELKKTYLKWSKCRKKIAYDLRKKNEDVILGTEAHAQKNYIHLSTKELQKKSLELDLLHKKVRGNSEFMLYGPEKGEVNKSMVDSAKSLIKLELSKRQDKKDDKLIDEYNELLGVKK